MNVDVIGKEGVSKFILSSKLTKFRIFRENARSGSTPVFDGSHCNTTQQVVSAFQSWADNILMANPGNNKPYEMLLYSKLSDVDDDLDNDEDNTPTKGKRAAKMKSVRFSFSLSSYAGYGGYGGNGGHVDVREAIKQALADRDKEDAIKVLTNKIVELEERLNGEEEEEEDERPSAFWDAVNMIRNKGAGNTHKRESVQVSGDKLSDEDKASIKKSLGILKQNSSDVVGDLELIASFAKKSPSMFANYMQTLRKSL